MMRAASAFLAVVALLAALPAGSRAAAPQPSFRLPTRFHGVWDDDLTQCGRRASEGRLVVTAGTLAFHDVVANVRRLVTLDPDAIRITTSTRADGRIWTSEMKLVLSRSDSDLTVSLGAGTLTRHRCV